MDIAIRVLAQSYLFWVFGYPGVLGDKKPILVFCPIFDPIDQDGPSRV